METNTLPIPLVGTSATPMYCTVEHAASQASEHSVQFFLQFSWNRVDLPLYESKPTDKREQYNWMAEKK